MMIKLDREVLVTAVARSRIALSSSLGNDQTVFLKFVVDGKILTIFATDLVMSSEVIVPLEESYEHLEFTTQGLNLDGIVPYLTASEVILEPKPEDLYVKIQAGNSNISVRSIPLTNYKDIADKFKDLEWTSSIDREELLQALTYVTKFAAEKENHPELSQVTIKNSQVFGGDVYQVGIFESPAIDPEISLSINVPLVPRIIRALKTMTDTHVSICQKDKMLILGEDGYHITFRLPTTDPAPLTKLLEFEVPAEAEIDRNYLNNAVRLVSVTLDSGSEQRISFAFKEVEDQQYMQVRVEVNGRVSDDLLPVRWDGDQPADFRLNYKDMLDVLAAINLNVLGISFMEDKKVVRFYEIDSETGRKTYSFLAILQRKEDAKPKSKKSDGKDDTAGEAEPAAEPTPSDETVKP